MTARSKASQRMVLGVALCAPAIVFGACSSFTATNGPAGNDASIPISDASIDLNASPSVDGGVVGDAGDAGDSNPAACKAYPAAVLGDKPFAYWRMGATSGVTIPDETGNGYELTLAGGFALGAKGALGCDSKPTVHFDGDQAHAFLPVAQSRVFDFGNNEPFTIETWVKRESTDAGATFYHVFGNKVGTTVKDGYVFYYDKARDIMVFEYDWPDGGVSATKSHQTNVEQYLYYAIVFDGSIITLFVNGVIDAMSSVPVQKMGARTNTFIIAGETDESDHYFAGAIDEVAVYARALTPTEINNHYVAATTTTK